MIEFDLIFFVPTNLKEKKNDGQRRYVVVASEGDCVIERENVRVSKRMNSIEREREREGVRMSGERETERGKKCLREIVCARERV